MKNENQIMNYETLLQNYNSLKIEYTSLKAENDLLKNELYDLRAKFYGRKRKQEISDECEKIKISKMKGAPKNHPGWYRKKSSPTEIIDVKLNMCPCCGNTTLSPCQEIKEHYQEDIVIPQKQVTLYRKQKYYCNHCKKTFTGRGETELSKSYIGPNAKTLAAILKYDIKVSDRDINKIFKNVFNLNIVTPSIAGFRNQLSDKFEKK
jgi:transposase